MRKFMSAASLVLAVCFATAGANAQSAKEVLVEVVQEDTLNVNLDSIRAEMSRCFVCSTVADCWYKLCPEVGFRFFEMDSFVVIVQRLGNSKTAKKYQEMCTARNNAFLSSLSFKADEAKSRLCRLCQKLHHLAEVGAHLRREIGNGYERLLMKTFGNTALNATCVNLTGAFPGRFGLIGEKYPQAQPANSTDFLLQAQVPAVLKENPSFAKMINEERACGLTRVKSEEEFLTVGLIDTSGKVDDALLLHSTNEFIGDAVLKVFKKMRFKPAELRGKKTSCWCFASIRIHYKGWEYIDYVLSSCDVAFRYKF